MKYDLIRRRSGTQAAAERTSAGRRGTDRNAVDGVGFQRVSPGGHLPSQRASTRFQRPY